MKKRKNVLIKSDQLREALGIPPDYELVIGKPTFPILFRKGNETIDVEEKDIRRFLVVEPGYEEIEGARILAINQDGIAIEAILKFS